ncbi:MAG: oligosaccharide flippase family protein [Candidatus Dadabacteria bacterium]|nr:oligosaccharide flippase family protein [Candidatus Dadabacteria bacterium]NIS09901.1 oligosaccharide flippase family protein [Candidatus Dadabacteria bacterium]NIV41730.1 oligosaccharide flippase family protein [Candidatus Dadabacteria bacterium]NIX16326.1 oligosaccharide flippase family protein [Candidatus Dadabacteria bacterium]NIY21147.1 oligosaccharide flippase family protein [Candidatus Dadabacteria bacterium]
MSHIKDRTKKLFLNASWLFGAKTAAGIFSALQTVIIARFLGVNDYGLLVLIIAYAGILFVICDFQFWETATKYIGSFWSDGDKERTASMVKLSYIIDVSSGIVAFLIAIFTAELMNRYLIDSPQAGLLIRLYAVSLLIDTTNFTSDAILRVFEKFKQISFIVSLVNLFRLVLVSAALYMGMGLQEVLYAYIAASVLGIVIRLITVNITLNEKGLHGWWNSSISLIKEQWKGISWFLANSSLTKTFTLASDNYLGVMILGYLAGNEATAFYKIARNCTTIIKRFMDPMYEAIYPELVNISTMKNLSEFGQFIKSSTKMLLKISTPVAIALLIFADVVITLVFGEKYLPAENALRLVTLSVLISQLSFWYGPALLALGKPGLRTIMRGCTTAFYIILLFILIPDYSYEGAAAAFLIFSAVTTAVAFINIRYQLKTLAKKDE